MYLTRQIHFYILTLLLECYNYVIQYCEVDMDNFETAINGVKIISKILNIPEPPVSFFNPVEVSNNEITGMYLFESDEIIFNEEWVKRSPWIEVIVTAFHETRHAYQGYCIRTKSIESIDTLVKWENETLNYVRPSGKNNDIDDYCYLNQSIEIDAIAFTHKKIFEFFNVKSVIPNMIKASVSARLNEL